MLLPEKLTGGGIQHQTGAQRIDRQGQQLHRCAAIPRHAIDAIGPRQVEPPGMTISDQMIDFGIAHPIAALAVDLTAAAAVERNNQDAGVVVGHIELAAHRINRQGIIARLRSRTHQGHVAPIQIGAPDRRYLLGDRLAPERERSHIRFTPIEFAIFGVNRQRTQRLGSGQEGHGIGAIQIGPFDDLLIDPVELVAGRLYAAVSPVGRGDQRAWTGCVEIPAVHPIPWRAVGPVEIAIHPRRGGRRLRDDRFAANLHTVVGQVTIYFRGGDYGLADQCAAQRDPGIQLHRHADRFAAVGAQCAEQTGDVIAIVHTTGHRRGQLRVSRQGVGQHDIGGVEDAHILHRQRIGDHLAGNRQRHRFGAPRRQINLAGNAVGQASDDRIAHRHIALVGLVVERPAFHAAPGVAVANAGDATAIAGEVDLGGAAIKANRHFIAHLAVDAVILFAVEIAVAIQIAALEPLLPPEQPAAIGVIVGQRQPTEQATTEAGGQGVAEVEQFGRAGDNVEAADLGGAPGAADGERMFITPVRQPVELVALLINDDLGDVAWPVLGGVDRLHPAAVEVGAAQAVAIAVVEFVAFVVERQTEGVAIAVAIPAGQTANDQRRVAAIEIGAPDLTCAAVRLDPEKLSAIDINGQILGRIRAGQEQFHPHLVEQTGRPPDAPLASVRRFERVAAIKGGPVEGVHGRHRCRAVTIAVTCLEGFIGVLVAGLVTIGRQAV